jgi:hypothetical protein
VGGPFFFKTARRGGWGLPGKRPMVGALAFSWGVY